MSEVPILITYDVHLHAFPSLSEAEQYFTHVLDEHQRIGVKAGFFFPAETARAESYRTPHSGEGSPGGCHGLTHRDEYYDSMAVSLAQSASDV